MEPAIGPYAKFLSVMSGIGTNAPSAANSWTNASPVVTSGTVPPAIAVSRPVRSTWSQPWSSTFSVYFGFFSTNVLRIQLAHLPTGTVVSCETIWPDQTTICESPFPTLTAGAAAGAGAGAGAVVAAGAAAPAGAVVGAAAAPA